MDDGDFIDGEDFIDAFHGHVVSFLEVEMDARLNELVRCAATRSNRRVVR